MADIDYVIMLRESLESKVSALEAIVVKDGEQKNVLLDPNATPDEFDRTVEEKSDLCDRINELDDGFEQLYAKEQEQLKQNPERYAAEIKRMKELIVQITDLTATIRKQEQENKLLMEQKFAMVKAKAKEVRKSQQAVNKYYKNMMKANVIDPQFMDRKK